MTDRSIALTALASWGIGLVAALTLAAAQTLGWL